MPDLDDSIPRYYLHTQHFMGGRIREPGSIIGWRGPPTNDMEPLNDAAKAKLDEFYLEEFSYEVEDPNMPGKMITVRHKPRLKLRPLPPGQAAENHEVIEIRAPVPKEQANNLTLAGMAQKVSTDQRPGPETKVEIPAEYKTLTRTTVPVDPMDLPTFGENPSPVDEPLPADIPLTEASPAPVGELSKSTIRTSRT